MKKQTAMVDGIDMSTFSRPLTIKELQTTNCNMVPKQKGIYTILRHDTSKPTFLTRSVGGWFKGLDPNYPQNIVNSRWVAGASILYIGKANGKNGLRQRLRQLVQFGMGKSVGHRGGRLIWHLKDSSDLLVRWFELTNHDADQAESELINTFKNIYGKRPYANLRK
jgi:hypothetical protein